MKVRLEVSPEEGAEALWGVVLVNLQQLRKMEEAYGFYPSALEGIRTGQLRYLRHDPLEHWKTYTQLMESGKGDCEDLTCAVVAELLHRNIEAAPFVRPPSFGRTYHVLVELGTGEFYDPSKQAGM